MGRASSPNAATYRRCATRRYTEACILRDAGQMTGAVYLAGYSIECILKALILSAVPQAKQEEVLSTFRGNQAHNFGWLRRQYLARGGASFPKEVTRCFMLVAEWTTELRYTAQDANPKDTDEFVRAAKVILDWAVARL